MRSKVVSHFANTEAALVCAGKLPIPTLFSNIDLVAEKGIKSGTSVKITALTSSV
jgi:D-ribose pyranose/furanose isomerase RbsD